MTDEASFIILEAKIKGFLLVDTPKALAIFRAECRAGFEKSLETLRGMVRARTPVFSGGLAGSISYELEELFPFLPGQPSSPIEFFGRVFSRPSPKVRGREEIPWQQVSGAYARVDYAEVVERGSRPHWPNLGAISNWVFIKLALGELSYAYHLGETDPLKIGGWTTFLVGRKISKVGTPGYFMFQRAREEFVDQGILKENMEEAVETATDKAMAETPWRPF